MPLLCQQWTSFAPHPHQKTLLTEQWHTDEIGGVDGATRPTLRLGDVLGKADACSVPAEQEEAAVDIDYSRDVGVTAEAANGFVSHLYFCKMPLCGTMRLVGRLRSIRRAGLRCNSVGGDREISREWWIDRRSCVSDAVQRTRDVIRRDHRVPHLPEEVGHPANQPRMVGPCARQGSSASLPGRLRFRQSLARRLLLHLRRGFAQDCGSNTCSSILGNSIVNMWDSRFPNSHPWTMHHLGVRESVETLHLVLNSLRIAGLAGSVNLHRQLGRAKVRLRASCWLP